MHMSQVLDCICTEHVRMQVLDCIWRWIWFRVGTGTGMNLAN